MKKRLLIVDDIPEVTEFIKDALRDEYETIGVNSGANAIAELEKSQYDLVITDVAMPDMSGEELTQRIKERFPDIQVLAVTAYGSIESATKLMRLGAYDYVEKPFSVDKLRHTIAKALEFNTMRRENRTLHAQIGEQRQTKMLVGNSVVMQHVREKINLVAGTAATILITGESGTGKEVVAQEIHRLSDRANKPFIKINCASIPSTLLENELFGHEKGAFTGAIKTELGKFELANNGTILLDEIGEMEHTIQAKLLRVIQEGEFDRVGGSRPIKVNVRLIATTNRNLRDEIRKGRFREDLYYRLNVVPMEMPSLRERREDIPLLVDHFTAIFSRKNSKDPIRITDDGLQKLCAAYWKGNVRQLQNIIERATILRGGMLLDADYFQFENEREEQMSKIEQSFRYGSIREMERLMIMNRLRENSENRTRSAETLDISVRTLRNKLHEYNVPARSMGSASVRREEMAVPLG